MPKLKLPTHDTITAGDLSVDIPRHYAPGDVLNAASSSLLNDHMLARFRTYLASLERGGRRDLTTAEVLALAAAEWLECCAVNGAIVTVRLACVVVKEENAT